MIDTNAWKIRDSDWVRQRDELWPVYFKLVRDSASSDCDFDDFLEMPKAYYDSGQLRLLDNQTYMLLSTKLLLLLHPSLDVKAAREVFEYCFFTGQKTRAGFVDTHFIAIPNMFIPMIEKGLTS